MKIKLLFSYYFDVEEKMLDEYGALNICLDSDLPLFIDPFLLFASEKSEYQKLHKKIVSHLVSLKMIAVERKDKADLNLFKFPEIKQNWLGLCKYGNKGKGLGPNFAKNIIRAFNGFFINFGDEEVTAESHIEKLTLINSGVGKDFISDFSTNLILEYLLEYTEQFAKKYLEKHQRKEFSVRCIFDEKLQIWKPRKFELPFLYLEENGDFIILTPIDILTKDRSFINHNDLVGNFKNITYSIGNSSLREAINAYFYRALPPNPKKREIEIAISQTINKYPEILDYYILQKERNKHQSQQISKKKIEELKSELISTLIQFCDQILQHSSFYEIKPNSYEEALKRSLYLKDVIENNDGYRIFYKNGRPIASEDTIQRIFRLTWYASPYDVNSEVNNGRGPADYKISFGRGDSTIVEFKLGRSSTLKNNLENQTAIYK